MEFITKKAYGKINLFLSVGKKRPDGRHEVENVMCRVGVYDIITLKKTDSGITVSADADLPTDENNIAYLAAKHYFERADIKGGADIKIEKHIPIKGGMGGGSSDAATVLEALNEMYGGLDFSALCEIAAELGADVPFFLYGDKVMLGRGTGTELTEVGRIDAEMYGVFVTCGEKQSTGRAYAMLDELRGENHTQKSSDALVDAVRKNDISLIAGAIENDFELCNPHFAEVKKALDSLDCIKAFLCGSGPTACGIFDTEEKARNVSKRLAYPSFVAKIGI